MKSKREQRHASIIFDHGIPIRFGYNTPFQHAEEAVITQGVNWRTEREDRNNYKGAIMVNIRITRGNRIGLAKPCPACYELLREKKFRKIIYSDNNGRFVEEYL